MSVIAEMVSNLGFYMAKHRISILDMDAVLQVTMPLADPSMSAHYSLFLLNNAPLDPAPSIEDLKTIKNRLIAFQSSNAQIILDETNEFHSINYEVSNFLVSMTQKVGIFGKTINATIKSKETSITHPLNEKLLVKIDESISTIETIIKEMESRVNKIHV